MHRPGRSPLLLELDLTRPMVEVEPSDLPGKLRARSALRWRRLVAAVEEAAAGDQVAGIIATVGSRLSISHAQELRAAVERVVAAGKPAFAWAETYGEAGDGTAAYLLASGFGEVWLQPSGMVGVSGIGVEVTFLRGLLDKLGVEPQLGQRREYKSAADRIMRREFTPAHEEMVQRLADSTYDQLVSAVAAGRRLSPGQVVAAFERGPLLAAAARDAGLVDRLGYRDEVYAAARRACGDRLTLRFADQWRASRPRRERLAAAVSRPPAVALVDVSGTIASGRSRRTPTGSIAGSATVTGELRAAARDGRVGAVVLRVDSPGGSAVASDTIEHEVGRVRQAGKPVIVSMGALAASGGYYVSCGADAIVATPATLTGSIGVVGGKAVVAGLLERIGVTTGVVERGDRARMFSARRPFTEDEWAHAEAWLDRVYADFIGRVAAGRRMSREAVEAVARGRVWTGADAAGNGLVDELGGLRRAVTLARERAGLPAYSAVRPPVHVPPVARLRRPVSSEDPRAAAALARSGMLPRLAGDPVRAAIDALALALPAASAGLMTGLMARLGDPPPGGTGGAATLEMPAIRLV